MTQQSSTLTVSTPSEREIVMTRTFDAPRSLVFEAHSKAEHIARWWGPRGVETIVDQMDFRPGGAWRYVHRGDDGEHAFRGRYLEIERPEKIVWTFEYEGMPGHVATETMVLTEQDGKTTITTTSVFDSQEDRDAMLQSGMEDGASQTYDRLAELLPELAS